MIFIVEPQCVGFAHEEVNAAFLYGFCKANESEEIIFIADKDHIDCVAQVLKSENLFQYTSFETRFQ